MLVFELSARTETKRLNGPDKKRNVPDSPPHNVSFSIYPMPHLFFSHRTGRLFKHQALAIDAAVAGQHVALSTATSSGKSVVFNVSVIEAILGTRPDAVALYLFPTKALAQDQLRCAFATTEQCCGNQGG